MNAATHPSLAGFAFTLHHHPDQLAIVDKNGKRYTYGDFSRHIAWSREKLQKKGVKKGTRVLIAVPMSMELYAILEAVFSLGAVAVFLDPWLKGKQMGKIIRQVRPDVFVIVSKYKWLAMLLPATWSIRRWWSVGKIQKSQKEWTFEPVTDHDVALITFTGGSSGMPKGADRTFGFLAAQLKALETHLAAGRQEVDFTNFPIVGLAGFAAGNAVVVPSLNLMKVHKANSALIGQQIESEKVTRLILSPGLLKKVVEGWLLKPSATAVKKVITGGAPIPFSLIRKSVAHFPDINFEAIYGSTEAEPIALTSFREMLQKTGDPFKGVLVGKPVKETKVCLIRTHTGPIQTEHFEPLKTERNKVGEVLVTGDHVNSSYFENEQAFRENKVVDRNGVIWHRTGDLGYFEQEELFLVGRLHRMVVRDGKEYHPYPLELYLETEHQLADTGYLEEPDGRVVLYLGSMNAAMQQKLKVGQLKKTIREKGYPLDHIFMKTEPLPRDPRHRSKLDIKALITKK